MIALMYPKDDYTAEQICTQVGLNTDNVYVVPKRIRNEEVIVKKLEKAELVILVVFDPWINLDILTRKDIGIAMQKGKKITAILPENWQWPFNISVDEIRYKPGDINDLSQKLIGKVSEIQKTKEQAVLLAVFVLILAFLLLIKNSGSQSVK